METLRDFTNRPGMTFDPDKTYILYAEDLAQMKENFALLNEMLSLSRQDVTSFIAAIKQGDIPVGSDSAPTPLEMKGADVLEPTNTYKGGDVALYGGLNQTTLEQGHTHLGSPTGSEGYSVSGDTSIHRFFPVESGEVDTVMTNDESDYLVFRHLRNFPTIKNVMRFLSSQVQTYQSGFHYSTDLTSATPEIEMFGAGDFVAVPFFCSQDFTLNRLGVNVYDSGGSGGLKFAVYDSGENGLPYNLLFGSGDIDADSSGFVFGDPSLPLVSGKIYWFCFRTDENISLYSSPFASSLNFGLQDPADDTFNTCLLKSLTYSEDFPSVIPFEMTDFLNNKLPVSFRFRVD